MLKSLERTSLPRTAGTLLFDKGALEGAKPTTLPSSVTSRSGTSRDTERRSPGSQRSLSGTEAQ